MTLAAGKRLPLLFRRYGPLGAETSDIQGTGLGLVSARQLAEAMGGNIHVVSTVNVGRTFFVDLPRASCRVIDNRPT